MKKALYVIILLVSCGVQIKEIALYDSYSEPDAEEKIEQIIFEDAVGTMWNSLFECGDFEITNDLAHSGTSCIKLSWAKEGCEWIGFGNSFNNWVPVDMSKDRYEKALSMYVRTQEKTAGGIPIVAAMEDYGGGGSYHFIGSKNYLNGLQIDTNWKQLIVPLWHFPVDEEMVDIRSIKQMQFQLEGSGSFFIDDITLIDYSEEQFQQMQDAVEAMKPKGTTQQLVYRKGEFEFDAWGQVNNPCQTLREITEENGNRYIHWEYKDQNCSWSRWGINWNGWYPINFRGITDRSKIAIRMKQSSGSKFKVSLKDFSGKLTEVFNSTGLGNEEWQVVEVPLKGLDLGGKGFKLDQIRELYFEGLSAGKIQIDEIKITE